MSDYKTELGELTQRLKIIHGTLDVLACIALAKELYSDEQRGALINEYRALRVVYRNAKAKSSPINGRENRTYLISQLGEEEGEKEFVRRKEIFAKTEASWDAIRIFYEEHPLIGALFSSEKAIEQRTLIPC